MSNSCVINEFTIKCGLCLMLKKVPTDRKIQSRIAYFKASRYFMLMK